MTDQTRANFEAHFQLTTRQAWQHKDGSYKFPEIQSKWEGYLAGVAKAAPAAPYLIDADLIWERIRDSEMSHDEFMEWFAAQLAAAAPGAVPTDYRNEVLEEAAEMVENMRWGWDGDCGAAENIRGMKSI